MLAIYIALLVDQFVVIDSIETISSTQNSMLRASYTPNATLIPKFTNIFTQYDKIFDGQNNTINNLQLSTSASYRAIFGLCNNATIQNLALDNFKFTIESQSTEQLAILCGTATNTTFKNLRISINSLISNFNSSGLIATRMINCTLINVTITGNIYINSSNNMMVSIFSDNIQNSTLTDILLQANIQTNTPNTNSYLINQINNSSISFMEVKNNYIINDSIQSSLLFQNVLNTNLTNVILYQNITQNNNNTKINLISQTNSNLNMSQVQLIINEGRNSQGLNLQQQNTSYTCTNCLIYTPENIPSNSGFIVINNSSISTAYNSFNKTGLIQNTVSLYELELLYKNNYYVNEKSECGVNECGDTKQCQTYQSIISNLVTVNYQRCICTPDKTGQFCENCVDTNKVMNIATWQCEDSNDFKCKQYGGYDFTLNKCRNCPLGYTGEFCNECIQNTNFVTVTSLDIDGIKICNLTCVNGFQGVCQRCKQGYTGDYCDQCNFNYKLNGSKCDLDPKILCAFHGGYDSNKDDCVNCSEGSKGKFCRECINDTTYLYVEFKCRKRFEHQCKTTSDFDYVRQKCAQCPINATGDLCDQCAPNYQKVNNICVPNPQLICIENGGYNNTTDKCNKCQDGYYGQFCNYSLYECCTGTNNCPNITQQSAECEKYLEMYCTNHGPLKADKTDCEWCQFGYVGPFCQICNQTFTKINGSCVPDFQNGTAPRCIKYNEFECLECQQGYFGYFCDQCLFGYYKVNDICVPYDVLKYYPCWNHGRANQTVPFVKCNHCFTGYQGDDCALCNVVDYISYNGQCVYNYTMECQDNGGYDVVNDRCRSCSKGFTGNFCTVCTTGIVRDGFCTTINTQRQYFITGLIAIVVVLGILLLILLILIIVFAVRCSNNKQQEQDGKKYSNRDTVESPSQGQDNYQITTPELNSNRNNLVMADTPLYKNRIGNQQMESSLPNSKQQGSQLVDSEEEIMQAEDQPIVDLDSEALDNQKRLQFIIKPRKFNVTTDIKNVTVSKHE